MIDIWPILLSGVFGFCLYLTCIHHTGKVKRNLDIHLKAVRFQRKYRMIRKLKKVNRYEG